MFAHWNPHQGVNPILRKATLEIPLLDSVVPTKGSAPMSFTRASVRRELDYSGLFVELLSGEVGFRGGRRVANLLATTSEDFTNAAWSKTNCTVAAGAVDPLGGASAYEVTATGSAAIQNLGSAVVGRTYRNSIWMRRISGTGQIGLRDPNGTNVDLTALLADGAWKRVTTDATVANSINARCTPYMLASGDKIAVWRGMVEDVTGQSNQNPSEYVSVGAAKLNDLVYTEDLTAAYWLKNNLTVTANQAADPEGQMTMSKLTSTGVANPNVYNNNIASPVASRYTACLVLLGGNVTEVMLQFYQNGLGAVNQTCTIISGPGSISGNGSTGITITGLSTTQHTKVMLVSDAALNPAYQVNFYIKPRASAPQVGDYIFACRPQIVAGTAYTDYFPVGNVYPFHGAMVDGVKWFTYENGNTVSGNVVTEARGPDIPYPQVLKGYTPMPAATNLLTYSGDLTNAAWTKAASVASIATYPPRLLKESLPSQLRDDSTAASIHGMFRNPTVTANTNYCAWLVVHSSGERFRGRIGFLDAATSSNGVICEFNARTGVTNAAAVGTGTLAGSGYINVAKGWGIVYVSGKIDAATTAAQVQFLLADSAGNLVYDGDGVSRMILGHFQLETGTVPTNIIPTTSAAVTIPTDSLTCPSAGLIGATGGSMSIEGSSQINDGATDRYLVSIDDGTVSERHGLIYRFTGAGGFASVDGGVAQANISTTNSVAAYGHLKLAARFAANNFAVVMNSGDVATDTSGTMPTVSVIRFGSVVNGGYHKGPVSYFRAWDTPLTDAELKAITANGYRDETVNLLTGWNDSSFISRDGRRLYFAYAPLFPYPFLLTQDYSYPPNGPVRRGSPGYTLIQNSFDIYCAHLRHDATVERIECLNLNTATESHFAVMEYMGQPWRLYMGYMSDTQTETRMRSAAIDANGKWTLNATSEFAAIHAGGADLGFNDDNPHVVLGTVCVFASGRTTGAVGGTDIWLATRAAIGDPWGTPVNPGVINTLGNEDQFYMHANMVDCYFSRDGEIWHVTWNGSGFNNDASKVTFAVSPALFIGECSIPDDFSYLYFTQIDQTTGVSRIMRAPWTGSKTAWGTPVAVD